MARIFTGTVVTVAGTFGLTVTPGIGLREVDRATAAAILEATLARDMAYDSERMPLEQAARLAAEFLASFPDPDTRFLTNGFLDQSLPGRFEQKVQCTESTFDGGVIAWDKRLAGCVWIEDED